MPTAVLSLNGAPQLELSARGDGVDAGGGSDAVDTSSVAGAATQRVMRLLGSVLRVKISDGRVVVGKFHCFDKHQNIILTDTREYLPLHRTGASTNGKKGGAKQPKSQQQEEEEKEEEEKELWKTGTSRSLGMALVPGKHIVYIKVECTVAADQQE